jgi:tetratricopeptide (TPR) repeat protein
LRLSLKCAKEYGRGKVSMKCPFKVLLFVLSVSAAFIFSGASICGTPPVSQTAKPAATAQAAAQDDEQESPPGYEEEYNCYLDANKEKETNVLNSGKMLIDCMVKFPKSTLMPNFEAAYKILIFESSNNKKYQELETLADQWLLRWHPNDYDFIIRSAEAADKLGHDEKYIQRATELYKVKAISSLAVDIASKYQKINKAKSIEWTETAIKLPENDANFELRFFLVQTYVESKDYPKIMEWAQATLKAAERVQDPGKDTRARLVVVTHACHDLIGNISKQDKKFPEAIKSFKEALKVKEYAEGYYYIGLCKHGQQKADDAMLWYAKTVVWCETKTKECGEFASKAKENMESIYKILHDGSLVGIDKIYKKAREKDVKYWTSDES